MYTMSVLFYKYVSDRGGVTLSGVDLSFDRVVRDPIESGDLVDSDQLAQAFKAVESSHRLFDGIFDAVDVTSKKLGVTKTERDKLLTDVAGELVGFDTTDDSVADRLGKVYEVMVKASVSSIGKKAGEHYTPVSVVDIISTIAHEHTKTNKRKGDRVSMYDPTSGSGSLLLGFEQVNKGHHEGHFYGREINADTYALSIMNAYISGISLSQVHIDHGDTLAGPPNVGHNGADVVLMNPPFSVKWSQELQHPNRYDVALPPKSKADYAFLLNGLEALNDDGVLIAIMPRGVLFREGAEGKIRKTLVDKGLITTIIALPDKMFYNTPIHTVALVIKKRRDPSEGDNDVLIINAENLSEKQPHVNHMTDHHVSTVIDLYNQRKTVDGLSALLPLEDIVANGYNLNTSRYFDPVIEGAGISIRDTLQSLDELDAKRCAVVAQIRGTLDKMSKGNNSQSQELTGLVRAISSSNLIK